MRIRCITEESLELLAPLLEASYGAGFDLKDEVEWFSRLDTRNWWYLADDDGSPCGFLRFFQVRQALYQAELFASQEHGTGTILALLQHFSGHHRFGGGTRVRFDLPEDSIERRLVAEHLPVAEERVFFLYERSLKGVEPESSAADLHVGEADLAQVCDVLAELRPYSVEEVEGLVRADALCVLRADGVVVGAAHHQGVGDGRRDVVTFGVAETARGQGHGRALLQRMLRQCAATGSDLVQLRVNSDNVVARRLYDSAGFQHATAKNETWQYIEL